jgi:hypothetical protein
MKFLDFVVLIMFVRFASSWNVFALAELPSEPTEFDKYTANLSLDLPSESSQFHPI